MSIQTENTTIRTNDSRRGSSSAIRRHDNTTTTTIRPTNWADSWWNTSTTWHSDPNSLAAQWRYYQNQLQAQNASNLVFSRPWLGRTAVPPASEFVVGLYRGEVMELIQDDPQLLAELVAQVGRDNLTKALEFARTNPTIAYGAPNTQQFQDFRVRKAEIFADLNTWIRDLALRQDALVYKRIGGTQTYWTLPGQMTSLATVGQSSTLRSGAQVSLKGGVSLILQILIAIGIVGGLVFMYQKFKK